MTLAFALRCLPYLALVLAGVVIWGLWEHAAAVQTKLDTANAAVDRLTKTIKEKEAARQSRATTDGAVRRMAPAEKLERLK